jgi:hypothetical protein
VVWGFAGGVPRKFAGWTQLGWVVKLDLSFTTGQAEGHFLYEVGITHLCSPGLTNIGMAKNL